MDTNEEHPPEGNKLAFLLISLITWLPGGGILAFAAILNGARTRAEVGEALQFAGVLFIFVCLLALLSIATGFLPTHRLGARWDFHFPFDRGEVSRRVTLRPEAYVSAMLVGFILVVLTGVVLEM